MSKIVIYGDDPVLVTPTNPIEKLDDSIKDLIVDMKKTMIEEEGIGLAANQIGLTQSIFIAGETQESAKAFINPEILESQGKIRTTEGCLSFPEIGVYVKRAKRVLLKYIDEDFKEQEEWIDGFLAIVCQHENDHLLGKTFIDNISSIRRDMIIKRINEIREWRDSQND